jgi:futalosine hydrolase
MGNEKVLLVTATGFEVEPTLDFFGCKAPSIKGLGVPGAFVECDGFDCLVTGVGQLQCAAHLMARLVVSRYSFVVQAGVAGSFSLRYPKRSVVMVGEEVLGDCGAETGDGFLDLGDMGLLSKDHPPFIDGVLRAVQPPQAAALGLPSVRSVTVNRTLADPKSIDWVARRFSPEVVNMEGAALFYVCRLKEVSFLQLRAISDMVGPRNKSSWDIPGAVEALNPYIIRLLQAR